MYAIVIAAIIAMPIHTYAMHFPCIVKWYILHYNIINTDMCHYTVYTVITTYGTYWSIYCVHAHCTVLVTRSIIVSYLITVCYAFLQCSMSATAHGRCPSYRQNPL